MQVMSSESSRTTANTGSRMSKISGDAVVGLMLSGEVVDSLSGDATVVGLMLSGEVVGSLSGESVWVDSRSHSVVYIHIYTLIR